MSASDLPWACIRTRRRAPIESFGRSDTMPRVPSLTGGETESYWTNPLSTKRLT